jgi:hypothetical protein
MKFRKSSAFELSSIALQATSAGAQAPLVDGLISYLIVQPTNGKGLQETAHPGPSSAPSGFNPRPRDWLDVVNPAVLALSRTARAGDNELGHVGSCLTSPFTGEG